MGRRHRLWAIIAPATVLMLAAGGAPALASQARPAPHTAARASGPSDTDWQQKYLRSNSKMALYCGGVASFNCVDVNGRTTASAGHTPWYVGHDEPSTLFYSNQPGSGNNNTYLLRLPKDPALQPKTDGTGGTWNFQQHPAFWFGMAMCDTQSFPEFSQTCKPDSNSNIAESTDPNSPQFLGRHPGAAFMEMQFYPPGWAPWPAGVSCDATKWCAALTIDSLNQNSAGVNNNTACLNTVGIEPVNFAFITLNGVPQAPPDPTKATAQTFTPDPTKALFMSSGDKISVSLHDTGPGFQVQLADLSTGQHGFMTASTQNGFGQVLYQPGSSTCNSAPYAFHPMYSTSGPDTRVPWAAHSYNVAMSDEIGHFEYCAKVKTSNGTCSTAGVTEGGTTITDSDDAGCFAASQSLLVKVSGCIGTDVDFDGPEYTAAAWAGSPNTPDPISFTSPRFNGGHRFSQVAFEADLPRIEDPTASSNNNCNRSTGAGCVNPPNGASFYPIFTTTSASGLGKCAWQEGGANIPGTTNTFGGTSQAEYGPLLKLNYASGPTTFSSRFNDFRQILSNNPC